MTALATSEQYVALVQQDPPAGLLDAASALVRKYCGWHLTPERVETFTLDGTGGHYLLLPSAHVVDVLSISNDGTTIDPLDAQWSTAGVVKLAGRWTEKMRGIRITVQHGWAVDEITDIALQTVLIAARVASAPRGEINSAIGGVSVQLGAVGLSLTAGEQAALGPYCIAGR